MSLSPDCWTTLRGRWSGWFRGMADYAHNVGAEDNAAGHVRANLVGHQVLVPVVDGRLQVGVWQDVLLIECDGPRSRTVEVRLLADAASA